MTSSVDSLDGCSGGGDSVTGHATTTLSRICSNASTTAPMSVIKKDSCCGNEVVEGLGEDSHRQDGCCGKVDQGVCASNTAKDKLSEDDCQDTCCSASNVNKPDTVEACNSGRYSTDVEQPDKEMQSIQNNCQDTCCAAGNVSKPDTDEDCDDGHCSAQDEQPDQIIQSIKNNCQDTCCSASNVLKTETNHNCNRSRHSAQERQPDKEVQLIKDDCQDMCCAKRSIVQQNIQSCCAAPAGQNKTKPCCDTSCVDRLAIRECESVCGAQSSKDGRQADRTACKYHRKHVRERYSTKLAALACICRALIALGQESCCITKEPSSVHERQRKEKARRTCAKSTDTGSSTGHRSQKCPEGHYDGNGIHRCRTCDVPTRSKGKVASSVVARGDTQGDSIKATPSRGPVNNLDIEKGVYGNEYIALNISGMTCTGCETKLQRVLGTVPAVSNLKSSLVMARIEFDLDTAAMSPASVVKHLERTTEFKCEQLLTQGSTVEVIPIGNVKNFLDQPLPLGVYGMQQVGKDVIRLNFDAKVIGARELIHKALKHPSKLAPPSPDPGLAAGSRHVRKIGYMTLLSAVLTIPVLVLAWTPHEDRQIPYDASALALATIIQIVVAGPFYPKALKSLFFSRMIEMDLLIVLSTSAAYVFSVISFACFVSGKPLSTGEFFETSTLLVSLIMVGRWIGALARQKAVESISIRSLQTSTAQLVTEDGTDIAEIDTRLLEYADVFSVLPEHRIPTDGIIIAGFSEVDESMLTGESRLIEKRIGSPVIAGSINGSGKVIVRLTHLPGENTISTIAGMVDNAKLSKMKIQNLADRVASYFVPTVVFLGVVTFVVWVGVGVGVRKQSGSEAAIQAITYAITVLIVSCPCAIGLAVPMVIVITSGIAAERGIIFKSADIIEIAHTVTHAVFDKTGTLTEGKLKVVQEQYDTDVGVTIKSTILGLVVNSKHPVSAAVATHLTEQGISPTHISEIKTVAGSGIEGMVDDGKVIRGGNSQWLAVGTDARVQTILAGERTIFCVTLDSKLYAIFALSDTIRPDAAMTIAELKQNGVIVSLLSGDNDGAVQHIAAQVGLGPDDEVRSRCSPGDKQEYIRKLLTSSVGQKNKKKRKAVVLFIGNGTNDAVALAQASIGVHMRSSTGTDIAQAAADVVLLRPSLKGVVTMINMSRAAMLRIKYNFAWSFIYNTVALLFASGVLTSAGNHGGTPLRIPPQYAGLGELVSVLPVIAIAIGLRWVTF